MKILGAIKICGMAITVKEGNERDCEDLKGAYACYDRNSMTIWIDQSVAKDKRAFWLTHEACHALLEASGALYNAAAIFGLPPDNPKMGAWEEAFIRLVTPHIVETFGPVRVSR